MRSAKLSMRDSTHTLAASRPRPSPHPPRTATAKGAETGNVVGMLVSVLTVQMPTTIQEPESGHSAAAHSASVSYAMNAACQTKKRSSHAIDVSAYTVTNINTMYSAVRPTRTGSIVPPRLPADVGSDRRERVVCLT